MTNILVADDHDLVRMGIVRMLADVSGFNVVGEAKSGEDAVAKARSLPVDVVLMDVRMPGFGGLEATRKIIAHNANIKVIVVTSLTDDLFPERLIKAGARGYVTKEAGFDEIIDAVRKVTKGQMHMDSRIAQQIALRPFNGQTNQSPFELLSERELQTAIMIASGNKVQAIADAFNVAPKTINSYRYRIFEKFDINSDVELTILAIKHKILDIETFGGE
ncbi:MAG: UvrY/SirA/GacA family response regulator transcription factor [Marinagarivorans sp.]|nr:UvrY/SirA/GacA family response regulator transcription factor [Marinagarivorans sp.]